MLYALIDCNNFYASCETVFQPRLDEKPVVVLSNNDGCIIARSQKAKQIGIEMGRPIFEYRDLLAQGKIVAISSNFTLYADMSHRVMEALSQYSSDMEIYSIDETFLLFDQIDRLKAQSIRQTVKKWTGIPLSIGIAPTKTLAKIANRAAKKRGDLQGVYLLENGKEIEEELKKTAVEDIWGIGAATSSKLKKNGIYNAHQLRSFDDQWIKKNLGIVGYRTVLELRGIPSLKLEIEPSERQSILCSRSFVHPIDNLTQLMEAFSFFISKGAEKLRKQKYRASFLSLFIATSPYGKRGYEYKSYSIRLANPTQYTPELIAKAKEGLKEIYQPGLGYKKGGICLADLSSEKAQLQLDGLATTPFREKREKMMETFDRINSRYDRQAIFFGAEGADTPWRKLRSTISNRYTTNWNELLIVKA